MSDYKSNHEINIENTGPYPLTQFPLTLYDDFAIFLQSEHERQHNSFTRKQNKQNKPHVFVPLPSLHKQKVEHVLLDLCREGYNESFHFNESNAADSSILFFLRDYLQQHRLVISGGFLLRCLGLIPERYRSPSITIYAPTDVSDRIYEDLPLLFMTSTNEYGVPHETVFESTTDSSYVSSIHTYYREEYKIHIVRLTVPYQTLLRHMDLSFCANAYDGAELYSMDPEALFQRIPGHLNPIYHSLLFMKAKNHTLRKIIRYRIGIYLVIGYSITWKNRMGQVKNMSINDVSNITPQLPRMNLSLHYLKKSQLRGAPSPVPLRGLRISDSIFLEKLQGPVSFYYMVPTSKAYEHYQSQGLALPLIILFGDEHAQHDGCHPCDLTDTACASIYDKKFLEGLDQLATHTPVDFYTESSLLFESNPIAFKEGVLFYQFFKKTTALCHRVPKRMTDEYLLTCPTSNMRWHYSDVRFMHQYIEIFYIGALGWYLTYIRNAEDHTKILSYSHLCMSFFDKPFSDSHSHHWNKEGVEHAANWFEYITSLSDTMMYDSYKGIGVSRVTTKTFLQKLLTSYPFKIREEDHLFNKIIEPSSSKEIMQQMSHHLSEYHSSLMTYLPIMSYYAEQILRDVKDPLMVYHLVAIATEFIVRIVDYFYYHISQSSIPSGILKQLQKQIVPAFQSIDFWKEQDRYAILYNHYIFDSLLQLICYSTLYYNKQKKTIDYLLTAIRSPRTYVNLDGLNLRRMRLYDTHLSNVTFGFMDTYTLLRMFKQPTNGVTPTLALSYLGYNHTRNISARLEKIGYHIQDHVYDEEKACLSFTQLIDLKSDVEAYTQRRNPSNVSQYVIQREHEKEHRRKTKKTQNRQNQTVKRLQEHYYDVESMKYPTSLEAEEAAFRNLSIE